MFRDDCKQVSSKELKIGDIVQGWRRDGAITSATRIVKGVNNFQVLLGYKHSDKTETVNAQGVRWNVELTEKEFLAKWYPDAVKNYKLIQNKLLKDQLGHHEMWNGWVEYDLFELCQALKKEKLTLIGTSTDIVPKTSWGGNAMTIGLCVEDETGNRFWCHVSDGFYDYIEKSIMVYEHVMERKFGGEENG